MFILVNFFLFFYYFFFPQGRLTYVVGDASWCLKHKLIYNYLKFSIPDLLVLPVIQIITLLFYMKYYIWENKSINFSNDIVLRFVLETWVWRETMARTYMFSFSSLFTLNFSQRHLAYTLGCVFSVRGSGECVSCPVSPLQKHTDTHTYIHIVRAKVNAEREEGKAELKRKKVLASSEWRKWRSCRTDSSPRRCCKRAEFLLALQPAFLSTLLHFIFQWGETVYLFIYLFFLEWFPTSVPFLLSS